VYIFILILLHLFSFKTPILLGKNKKNIKSIVGISPTMVLLYYPGKEDIKKINIIVKHLILEHMQKYYIIIIVKERNIYLKEYPLICFEA
jgi:hypothetical protein